MSEHRRDIMQAKLFKLSAICTEANEQLMQTIPRESPVFGAANTGTICMCVNYRHTYIHTYIHTYVHTYIP
jgi:hypothetical protein